MADVSPDPDQGKPPDEPTQPLFGLNRRRHLLYVNAAWETLTGLKARDVNKGVCKRQRDAAAGSVAAVQHALSPPREALAGELTHVRRLFQAGAGGPCWWVCWG
jgi:hypothetical protein